MLNKSKQKPTSKHFQTNKTEMARYLDIFAEDVPQVQKRLNEYQKIRGHFGQWYKGKYNAEFSKLYNRWWLKTPSLWGVVYECMEEIE